VTKKTSAVKHKPAGKHCSGRPNQKLSNWQGRNKLLFVKNFNLVLLFEMLSVAVECAVGKSLCSSRYQRASLQHALASRHNGGAHFERINLNPKFVSSF